MNSRFRTPQVDTSLSIKLITYEIVRLLNNEWRPCSNREPDGEIQWFSVGWDGKSFRQNLDLSLTEFRDRMIRPVLDNLLSELRKFGARRFIQLQDHSDSIVTTDTETGISVSIDHVITYGNPNEDEYRLTVCVQS